MTQIVKFKEVKNGEKFKVLIPILKSRDTGVVVIPADTSVEVYRYQFGKLKLGDKFEYCGNSYQKTEYFDNRICRINAVNTHTGIFSYFDNDDDIEI